MISLETPRLVDDLQLLNRDLVIIYMGLTIKSFCAFNGDLIGLLSIIHNTYRGLNITHMGIQ